MIFFREADLAARQVRDGITLRALSGDRAMLTIFTFEPHAVIPSHEHAHEQITYVVEGELEFTVEGETRLLKAGDGVVILSHQEHSARVLGKPAKAVDAWHPMRDDYREGQS